ncbi:AraC family transcriptional regulator [Paenibacillus sp. UNC499MF]|uniref:AraC family transcriptional regulator n=1 Tax=Paenibacillus sp. UNC499MF TaxID=1502751 RepID=UPI00089FC0AB|nr:helix-turn-helix domain-containing protein [Paenibacillus sp. UNC499MF]SEF85318.1 Helix-turn-helix domain-containing protein [Paenibacillus sp. UNC499MF]
MPFNKTRPTSLFLATLISFLVIIGLFAAFDLAAFAYFKTKYHGEIIAHNQSMLKNTAEKYSTHFSRIKTLLFNTYNDPGVVAFNRHLQGATEEELRYLEAKSIVARLRSDTANPHLFLDNLVVYFLPHGVTLDKDGSSGAEDQYNRLYKSAAYPLGFWENRLKSADSFSLLPAADFKTVWNSPAEKKLLPVSFHLSGGGYLVTAYLDVDKTQRDFLGEGGDGRLFYVLNGDGSVLFGTGQEGKPPVLPAFEDERGTAEADGMVYFRHKGDDGLTYITGVSNASMASQLRKLNGTLLAIFLLSLGIALAVSLLSSRRINRPVKQLVSAFMSGSGGGEPSAIREFAFIQEKIADLLREKTEIRSELRSRQSLLTKYSYINKLRSIHTDIHEWQDFIASDESFQIIVYELRFRQAKPAEEPVPHERLASYYREHLDVLLREHCPGSHTFQMEKNQILTVISGAASPDTLQAMLADIRHLFDSDKEQCLAAVAVSSRFEHASQFNDAYRQALERAGQATLAEETQVILETRSGLQACALSPAREQELNACLQAGDDKGALELIGRQLAEMRESGAGVVQYRQLAESIAAKIWKLMDIYKIAQDAAWPVKPLMRRLKECCTFEDYIEGYRELFFSAASLIYEKKDTEDPVIRFVMDTLRDGYGDELSLENLADRLRMSSAYLSVYIKEKTGANFSDHLNAIRVSKAQELLSGTQLNIVEVGLRIGYRNITSFNRMFKKWTGQTPGEYRRAAKLNAAE